MFGERLKLLRKDKDLTQQELGDMINVTKVSICCYEKGNRIPTIDTLLDLSNVFGVDANYLLGTDSLVYIREGESEYGKRYMSKEEINFINELKKNKELFNKVLADPKRIIELLNMTLK